MISQATSDSSGASAPETAETRDGFPREELALLAPRIEGLLFGRALVFTVLLGAALLFQYTQSAAFEGATDLLVSLSPIYGVIIFVYLLSILYVVVYRNLGKSESRFKKFAVFQIVADELIVSYLLLVSGGTRSVFPFLYLMVVVYAGILLSRRGALFSALLSSSLYPLVLWGMRKFPEAILETLKELGTRTAPLEELIYASFVNMGALFMTAALVSYLAERLRLTGERLARREIDYAELEELHREIVTNLTSGIITVDTSGDIIYLNHAAEEMLGRTLADVYKQPLRGNFMEIADALDRVKDEPGWDRPEIRVTGARGSSLVLGFSISALSDGAGGRRGSIIIFQDLTRLKQAEARLKRQDRLAAVGELAASIAHEIRNPLASISGSVQMLETSDAVSTEDARLMAVVQREIHRLDALIGNFLQYSRPMDLQVRETNVPTLVREVLETFERLRDQTCEIDFVVSSGEFTAQVDPDQLKQVLWNLLINARNAMEPTGGRITVEVATQGDGADATFSIRVSDTGPGVKPEDRQKIFTPFHTTRVDGSGLGLALVDRIIGLHGGEIEVGDAPSGGASFTVTLPMVPPQARAQVAPSLREGRA